MKLNKNMKLFIIIGLAVFILIGGWRPQQAQNIIPESIIPLNAYPISVSVIVKDIETLDGIGGASVSAFMMPEHIPLSSGVTGLGGVVVLTVLDTTLIKFEVNAQGYDSNSLSVSFMPNQSKSTTILMTKSVTPPTSVYANVYCVDNLNRRVRNVIVSSSKGITLSDGNGLARIPVSMGGDVITLDSSNYPRSQLANGGSEPCPFSNYLKSVNLNADATFTAYVQQAVLVQQVPPDPSGSGNPLWDFLLGSFIPGIPNWMLCAFVLVLLIVLGR